MHRYYGLICSLLLCAVTQAVVVETDGSCNATGAQRDGQKLLQSNYSRHGRKAIDVESGKKTCIPACSSGQVCDDGVCEDCDDAASWADVQMCSMCLGKVWSNGKCEANPCASCFNRLGDGFCRANPAKNGDCMNPRGSDYCQFGGAAGEFPVKTCEA